jgi:hypothetical protein
MGFYKQISDFHSLSKIFMPHIEIVKFCQNHWSPISIQPFLHRAGLFFVESITAIYEQTAIFTTSHLRLQITLKRNNKIKKRAMQGFRQFIFFICIETRGKPGVPASAGGEGNSQRCAEQVCYREFQLLQI